MKKIITPFSMAAALLLTACSVDDVTGAKDDSEKTPIEFSMTDNTGSTVAVSGISRAGFTEETGIVMRMVANNSSNQYKYTKTTATAAAEANSVGYSQVTFPTGSTRYWDDAYGRDTKLSIYAVAVPGKTTIKNLDNLGSTGETSWSASSSTAPTSSITWTLSKDQTTTTASGENTSAKDPISDEDLTYSNNIMSTGTKGVYKWDFTKSEFKGFSELTDGQMIFSLKTDGESTGPGKFDKGNLNFTHALSRVTINVELGDGFTTNDDVSAAKLLQMPYNGTLDVQKGTFTKAENGTSDITMDKRTTKNGYKATYLAQVLPDYEISKTSDTNVLQFNVGENVYYVTQASVYEALVTKGSDKDKITTLDENNNKFTMAQGQNYVLNITVSKTGIVNMTATLADWTDITGAYSRNNAYLTFSFLNTGTSVTSDANAFDIYRAADDYENYVTDDSYVTNNPHYNWTTGYSNTGANLTYENSLWKTNWYWDTNKAFYHFRLVGKQGSGTTASTTVTSDATNGDYFAIKSGATSQNATWGAPFKSGATVSYNTTNGFAVNAYSKDNTSTSPIISPAIGATNSTINFTMLNMLAHIKVNILTTSGNDKVTLIDESKTTGNKYTKVYLSKIYTSGTVNMGNGLVKQTGSRATSNTEMTAPTGDDLKVENNKIVGSYDYYVVPQSLIDGNTYVGLYIQTPDDNVYYVVQKLSEITASSVKNGTNISIGQSVNSAIQYWYPNCCYTYNITLSKTGITNITATLVPYTEISGDTNISIED